jgi:sialate O-acetylesterase
MINPLIPFAIKGVVWYQGEDNTPHPAQYRTLFPALISDWRHRWGYEFPFLFVQLAGFGTDESESGESHWAELREAQAMALSVPRTGMATAVDIGDAHDVHPKNKQDVAHRLALSAMKVAYGEDVVYSGPIYQSMHLDNGSIRIKFSNVAHGLRVKDSYGYLRGFEISAKDGKYTWAQARVTGPDEVVVSASSIKEPVDVRYDWGNTPEGGLYNSESLPALPFRTGSVNSN